MAVALFFNIPSMATSSTTPNEKISERLFELMSSNNETTVSIWLSSPNISSQQKELKNSISNQGKDAYRVNKRTYLSQVSEIYVNHNQNFVNSFMDIDDIIYISKYSPMIIANLSSEEIIFLCDKAEVISIDVYSDNDFVSSNIETCSYAQLDTMEEELNSLGYTGSGISIGIIDSGIPLVSELDSDCLIGEMYGEYDGTHSSYVTNIMLSIAPDATYYFAGKP